MVTVQLRPGRHAAGVIRDDAAYRSHAAACGIGSKHPIIKQERAIGSVDSCTRLDPPGGPILQKFYPGKPLSNVDHDIIPLRLTVQARPRCPKGYRVVSLLCV